MDPSNFTIMPLIAEVLLLVLFIITLFARGTKKGDTVLVVSFGYILLIAALSFVYALYDLSRPVPPPPEIWSEAYYDSLSMRSTNIQFAAFNCVILFVLFISYAYAKFRESPRTSQ